MVDDHSTNFVNISEALNSDQNVFVGCTSKNKEIEAHAFANNYFLNSGNLPENECLQMTARNRCARDIYVSCGDQSMNPLMTNFELLREGEGKKIQCFVDDSNDFTFSPMN